MSSAPFRRISRCGIVNHMVKIPCFPGKIGTTNRDNNNEPGPGQVARAITTPTPSRNGAIQTPTGRPRTGARRTVVRLEQGRFASPSPAKLAHLAAALNLPLADVFAGAGYLVPDELPSFEAYLRARYPELSARTRNRLIRYFQDITGISPDIVVLNREPGREGTLDSGID